MVYMHLLYRSVRIHCRNGHETSTIFVVVVIYDETHQFLPLAFEYNLICCHCSQFAQPTLGVSNWSYYYYYFDTICKLQVASSYTYHYYYYRCCLDSYNMCVCIQRWAGRACCMSIYIVHSHNFVQFVNNNDKSVKADTKRIYITYLSQFSAVEHSTRIYIIFHFRLWQTMSDYAKKKKCSLLCKIYIYS